MERRIVIVGGGVIGLCVALRCRERGLPVTVLERGGAARDGCSYGNAGMVVPSHFVPLAAPGMVGLGLRWMFDPESPFRVKPRASFDLAKWSWKFWRSCTAAHVARSGPLLRDLHLASKALFEEFAAAGWDFGLNRQGLLILCRDGKTFEEEAHGAEKAKSLGIPAEIHPATELAALEPDFRLTAAGAVKYPQDACFDPRRFMAELERRLELAGVELRRDTEVLGFRRDGKRVTAVRTASGDVPADEVVIAGGAWSGLLTRELGLRLPLEAGKGYSLTLPQPRQLPRHCLILAEARVAVTPLGTSLRFGGTLELAGLDESIDPARVRGIVKSIPHYCPEFRPDDFAGISPWRGLRPCSPDGLPYLGRTARSGNVVIAGGHAMMGMSLGPITGEIVARLLCGEPAGIAGCEMLSPDRFG